MKTILQRRQMDRKRKRRNFKSYNDSCVREDFKKSLLKTDMTPLKVDPFVLKNRRKL